MLLHFTPTFGARPRDGGVVGAHRIDHQDWWSLRFAPIPRGNEATQTGSNDRRSTRFGWRRRWRGLTDTLAVLAVGTPIAAAVRGLLELTLWVFGAVHR